MIVKPITPKQTYAIRHRVLRQNRPIEDCMFLDDDLETTIHLGLSANNQLVGVSTFLKENNKIFTNINQYRLRGMAVLQKYQGYGFGNSILKYGEQLLKQKNVTLIWCNARETAIKFYQKNNYRTVDNPFEIENIGIHYIMYKII